MKWGVRRYQNPDGTLTELGKKHYSRDIKRFEKLDKKVNKSTWTLAKRAALFDKRAKMPTLTDTHLELKRRAGVKLANAKRSYLRDKNRANKLIDKMQNKYGISNVPSVVRADGRKWISGQNINNMRIVNDSNGRYHTEYLINGEWKPKILDM